MTAVLRGFGAPPTPAVVVLERLSTRQRLVRAGAVLGVGLVAAAVALPIPLVHFVLVPASILAGAALAVHRLGQREIVRRAEASCPFCGTHQRLGLDGKSLRLPRRIHCSRCGREADLEPAIQA